MGLCRGINSRLGLAGGSGLDPRPVQRALSHRQDRREGCRGGTVVDDTAQSFGQSKRLAHPVHHARFHFRGGGRGLPQHALGRDRGDELFGQQGRRCGVGRKIGKKARMLPVGHAVRNDPFEVGENSRHVLTGFRRGHRKLFQRIAWLGGRAHRAIPQTFVIPHSPVDQSLGPDPIFRHLHDGAAPRFRLFGIMCWLLGNAPDGDDFRSGKQVCADILQKTRQVCANTNVWPLRSMSAGV